MKNKLRKTGYLLAVGFICLLVCGCSSDPRKLDGKYVRGAGGTIYEVEAGLGDTYFIREADLAKAKTLVDMEAH